MAADIGTSRREFVAAMGAGVAAGAAIGTAAGVAAWLLQFNFDGSVRQSPAR